jgi:hypothetical protein
VRYLYITGKPTCLSGQLIRSLWLRVTSSLHLSAFILFGRSPKSLFVLDLWHSSKTKWQWQWAWAIAHPFSMNWPKLQVQMDTEPQRTRAATATPPRSITKDTQQPVSPRSPPPSPLHIATLASNGGSGGASSPRGTRRARANTLTPMRTPPPMSPLPHDAIYDSIHLYTVRSQRGGLREVHLAPPPPPPSLSSFLIPPCSRKLPLPSD